MPSISQQGINFSKTVFDIIQDTIKGNDLLVDNFEKQRRYNICEVCEYFFQPQARCKKCGCFMEKKVEFRAAKCPMNKW
jgi:predicted Zn-ribbon and HTH transcriptional regulator